MQLFHSLETTDWTRVSLIVGAITVFWQGLKNIIPVKYHETVLTVLLSISSAVTLLMRSGKSPQKIQEEKEKP